MSSDSVKNRPTHHGDMGFRFFRRVLRTLFLSLHAETDGENTATGHATSCEATTDGRPGPSCSSGNSGFKESHKRQRGDHDEAEDDDENDEHPPQKKSKEAQPGCSTKPTLLACPFLKLDRNEHWECFFRKITTIGYLKQHLTRRHTPGLYCQRCFHVFQDQASHNQHVLVASCTRTLSAQLEVVSQYQSTQLSEKSRGSLTDQWYAIWRILFPGQPRPSSIYINTSLPEDFALLHNYSQEHDVEILRSELRASRLILRSDVSDADLQEVLGRALNTLFESFRATRQLNSEPSDSVPSSQTISLTQLDNRAAPRSIDSGVILGSHILSTASRTGNTITHAQVPRDVPALRPIRSDNERPIDVDPANLVDTGGNLQPDANSSLHPPDFVWDPWYDEETAIAPLQWQDLLDSITVGTADDALLLHEQRPCPP